MKDAGLMLGTVEWITERARVLKQMESVIDELLAGSTTGLLIFSVSHCGGMSCQRLGLR
jgi:hypothetical protein